MENVVAETPSASNLFETKDAIALTALATAGFLYFSQYYNHGFFVGDEGSALLIATRLLAGDRPFIDIELGYGPLWFYPLVLLFKATGVSFIVLRTYFLFLAQLTALLAYLTIRAQNGKMPLAFAIGLLILLVPGTVHKSYIPLIVIANMLLATMIGLPGQAINRNSVFSASLVASVSYYIRPDIGMCALFIFIVTLTAHAVSRSTDPPQLITQAARFILPIGAGILMPTLPLFFVAYRQGFLSQMLDFLFRPFSMMTRFLELASTGSFVSTAGGLPEGAGTTLARTSLSSIFEVGPHRIMAILTYLPILSLVIIAASACSRIIQRAVQKRPVVEGDSVGILALLGLAYSAFPQFFFFRPDGAHLSQFMPGYLVIAGVYLGRWVLPRRNSCRGGSPAAMPVNMLQHLGLTTTGLIFIFHLGLYEWFGSHQAWAGSIALSRGRTERFEASNGIDVYVKPGEKRLFEAVMRVIRENSTEDEAVLCFPYSPGFNMMADRTTCARKLYVDDAILILDPGWQQQMIDQIKRKQPALIIIGNEALNGTEISRFPNWATQVMQHITSTYRRLESIQNLDFYVRDAALTRGTTAAEENPDHAR